MTSSPTANAKVIIEMMETKKVKGNYKDYVIIAGNRLVDWRGSWEIRAEDQTIELPQMSLTHKKDLHKLLGDVAKVFWSQVLRRRINGPCKKG